MVHPIESDGRDESMIDTVEQSYAEDPSFGEGSPQTAPNREPVNIEPGLLARVKELLRR